MEVFINLNKRLTNPNHRFIPDTIVNKQNVIVFTTVYNDLNVIPTEWYENGLACKNEIQEAARWINKNVFQLMINNLLWKNKTDCTTELVKKRIFVTMLSKLPISNRDKIDWEFWINDLYWARKRAIVDYYLSDIVNLPF